jgi:hypothetical protein
MGVCAVSKFRLSAEALWERPEFGMWLIFAGLCAAAYLLWWLPSPGIGVAVMGIAAALMSARKDPGGWEKAGWTFMMFALLLVEILAIRKDRREHDEQVTRLLNEEVSARLEAKTSFEGIGEGIKGQSRQSQQQFENTVKQQETQFSATMNRFSKIAREQAELYGKQQEMIESANAHLLPGDDPMPTLASLGCSDLETDSEDYFLLFGNMTNIVHDFPYSLVRVYGKDVISLAKSESGLLILSMDIRDRSGAIIARFDENGFEVAPTLLKRHPDKSTLIVEDSRGNQLLKARYNNRRLFTFSGNGTLDVGGAVKLEPGPPKAPWSPCTGHSSVGISIH